MTTFRDLFLKTQRRVQLLQRSSWCVCEREVFSSLSVHHPDFLLQTSVHTELWEGHHMTGSFSVSQRQNKMKDLCLKSQDDEARCFKKIVFLFPKCVIAKKTKIYVVLWLRYKKRKHLPRLLWVINVCVFRESACEDEAAAVTLTRACPKKNKLSRQEEKIFTSTVHNLIYKYI